MSKKLKIVRSEENIKKVTDIIMENVNKSIYSISKTTRILIFKYTSDKAVDMIVTDIIFCGGTVKEKTKLLSQGLIYIKIEENDNSFVRRFRETRSGNFLLNK